MAGRRQEQGQDLPGSATRLRQKAEYLAPRKGNISRAMSAADIDALLHELEVHQVELELQNEELRRAQQEIQASRDRYAELFEFAPVGYFMLDRHFKIQEGNLTGSRLLGVERGRLYGKMMTAFVAPACQDIFYRCLKAVSSEDAGNCEATMHRQDGGTFHAELKITREPATSADGSYRLAVTDITERKKATEALRRSEASLAEAQRIARIGSWQWNVKTGEVRWSEQMYSIFGLERNAPVPGVDSLVKFVHPEDRESVNAAISRVVSQKGAGEVDFRIIRPDGSIRALHAEGTVTRLDECGEPLLIVGIDQDITERKKAEQIKDEFLSMVSHEMKTPLTVILGGLHILVKLGHELTEEDRSGLLQDAYLEAGSLTDTVSNLLEMSRYQADRLSLVTEPVDMKLLLRHMVDRAKGQHPGHHFVAKCTRLPVVKADRIRLERIVYNLLDNAAKYSPQGSPVQVSAGKRGNSLVVRVRDQGEGISKEDQDRRSCPSSGWGGTPPTSQAAASGWWYAGGWWRLMAAKYGWSPNRARVQLFASRCPWTGKSLTPAAHSRSQNSGVP